MLFFCSLLLMNHYCFACFFFCCLVKKEQKFRRFSHFGPGRPEECARCAHHTRARCARMLLCSALNPNLSRDLAAIKIPTPARGGAIGILMATKLLHRRWSRSDETRIC